MKHLLALAIFLLPLPSFAKPSYSFGNEARHCKTNADCALLTVSCHKCDWVDAVSKDRLAASEKTVKDYCDGWKKDPGREKDCTEIQVMKEREAVCREGLCEAHSFPDFSRPPIKVK